jgi:hypothetical protein
MRSSRSKATSAGTAGARASGSKVCPIRSSPPAPSARSSLRWARTRPPLDDAIDLAERLAAAAEEGRVDLGDLGRRARRVLENTVRPPEPEQLF